MSDDGRDRNLGPKRDYAGCIISLVILGGVFFFILGVCAR